MRRALAIALFALASCRNEAKVEERPQPLQPSGEPVAQAPTAPSDTRDEPRDDRTATARSPSRADDKPAPRADRPPRADSPPPRADEPAPRADAPPPAPVDEPSIEEQLPPSLFEANGGGPKPRADKPDKEPRVKPPVPLPSPSSRRQMSPIRAALCVTTGAAKIGGKIDKAMRAVAKGTDGEGAALTFVYNGELDTKKKLDSGAVRRQIGLKLRAENGCNLLYVMWRLDPKPMVVAQIKRNRGAKDHEACGSGGYKWIKASEQNTPPELVAGARHTMRAEIENEELQVFIDDTLYWRGKLPETAHDLRGPAGIRSDNLAFDLVSFDAAETTVSAGNAKCVAEDKD